MIQEQLKSQIDSWSSKLTFLEMRELVNELIFNAIEAEEVRFGDLAPYWRSDGKPLIHGQQTYLDE